MAKWPVPEWFIIKLQFKTGKNTNYKRNECVYKILEHAGVKNSQKISSMYTCLEYNMKSMSN